MYCYNKQDTIGVKKTEIGYVYNIKGNYSDGCNIFQIISKDSIKQIAQIFKNESLEGVTDGYQNLKTKVEIKNQQLKNEIFSTFIDLESNRYNEFKNSNMFLETIYKLDNSIREYQKFSTRFYIQENENAGFYVE